MIAEKIERQLDRLQTLIERNNGDLRELAGVCVENMRGELDRLRAMEEAFTPATASGVRHA